MEDRRINVILGGLFHDIGKVLYRYNDGRNHSNSGYDFMKENGVLNQEILEQVKYHHVKNIRNANIDDDSLAYITYWADNVASGADRRNLDIDTEGLKYDKYVALESVFNILNGNNKKCTYEIQEIFDNGEINYPTDIPKENSKEIYGKIISNLSNCIKRLNLDTAYINSALGVLEANLSYVPSSSDKTQLVDISLFDHMKITAAIGSCLHEYFIDNGITNYKEALFDNESEWYKKDCFLMFAMDISGIQNFLYSIGDSGALKTLRAKSFYLEIMLEHVIDELLERLNLSRANLIYSGGGHAYILLPNTENVKSIVDSFEREIKKWYLDNFDIKLYIAMGYQYCSANDLMNISDNEENVYESIFKKLSERISDKKANRYSFEEIKILNNKSHIQDIRECSVCGRTDLLNDENLCEFCDSFQNISNDILYKDFVTILSSPDENVKGIRLPLDRYMIMENEERLFLRIKNRNNYIRSYSKNKMYTGHNMATRLWIGDYAKASEFSELANSAKGVKKLGVLRGDVDNLGQAFVRGFESKYSSLSRTATFSRKMNMFFKLHVNNILRNGEFTFSNSGKERNIVIVYSGGDDMFLIGAWNEIIEVAVDVSNALKLYTLDALSISAGVGIFPSKYPVKAMARQTGALEDTSKKIDGKDSITLFEDDINSAAYKWEDFQNGVINEKYRLIEKYFMTMQDKGMSSIYKLMGYIRNIDDDRINLARLAYMLGRMEPDKKASQEIKNLYYEFAYNIYEWVEDDEQNKNKKELIKAIYLYVYLHRENDDLEVSNG